MQLCSRRIMIGMALCCVVLLTACETKTQDVALVIYDFNDLYMQDFEQLIYEQNSTFDFELKSYDSQNSQIIQNDLINDIIDDDPSLIIINPVDRLGVYPIIEKAKEQDVSIIFINREPLESDLLMYEKLYYVGAKPEQSATYQADIIKDLFGGDPLNLNTFDTNGDGHIQLIILKGQPGHQDAEIRTEKVVDELENSGFLLDILSIEVAYFSQSIAEEQLSEALELYGLDLELVIANNDAMALGAIEALTKASLIEDSNEDGRIDWDTEPIVPVVGIDGLPVALDMIDNGFLAGTVINDSATMALAINELSSAVLNGTIATDLTFTLEDGTYIWVDYKTYTPND